MDEEFQRKIIDVFINSVYIYDDKIVIYYNVKDGKQVSYVEMLESTEEPPFGGDPDSCNGVRISNELPRHQKQKRTRPGCFSSGRRSLLFLSYKHQKNKETYG
jgi:hypothetical protein